MLLFTEKCNNNLINLWWREDEGGKDQEVVHNVDFLEEERKRIHLNFNVS